ncbi:MAG TPA: hypothetical protein VGT41_06565 [Candidatus Babeliales bacterium]|nr:hypothetical protein [Candidatus Babeliales bacterium]
MNYITIKKHDDFQALFDVDVLITGDLARQREELEWNTWHLSFDKKFVQKLKIDDLQRFVAKLIDSRVQQLRRQSNHTPVTFYVWFEKAALQLCFDFLSGKDIKLPFERGLNLLSSIDPVLTIFLSEAQRIAIHGNLNDFIESVRTDSGWEGDPGWDDDEPEWIQDVYVTTLKVTPC